MLRHRYIFIFDVGLTKTRSWQYHSDQAINVSLQQTLNHDRTLLGVKSSQDIPFPRFSCEWSGQLKVWPDHIPDYYWAKPGHADPGKTTAQWRQHFSGVQSSGGPGQRSYDRLSMSERASFPGSVYVQWLWWPVRSLENRQQVARVGTCWPNKQRNFTHRKIWELSADRRPSLYFILEDPLHKRGVIVWTK